MIGERAYINLVKKIIKSGKRELGRNGETKVCIGESMRFSLKNNRIPLLTTKKMAWKTCLRELLWFINGDTDNANLQKEHVNIWNANGSRDFLDARGLQQRKKNDLGPIYGFQWRHFGDKYIDANSKYEGTDQLQMIVDQLKKRKDNRRLIMSAWNPTQLDEMALPPCHILSQFHITNGRYLSCSLYQRSADIGLGVPFNIASYSFLTNLLAHHCSLEPYELVHFIGNAHIYKDHLEVLEEQTEKKIYPPPTLKINKKREDIGSYNVNDFKILNYWCGPKIPMKMRI